MDEDDETHSLQSPRDSSSPPNNNNNVTIATTKPSSSNALALVQTPSGRGGGRDDCWSEEATKVLIEAWGERFSEPGKGTLKQQQWKEVAEIVNESRQCKFPRTDVQCKNRIDTVKKKYKQEKTKIASGDGPSKWIFFKKLESLIGGLINNNNNNKGRFNKRQGKGTIAQIPPMRWHFRKRSASETESESEPEPELPSPESSESLPKPPPPPPKRLKTESGVGDVAKAILGFTEAYEKAETAKIKLMMELEKERMKFAKEMELQRMQFLKTQLEITQSNQEEEERSRRRIVDDDDDVEGEEEERNVENNGNVSS